MVVLVVKITINCHMPMVFMAFKRRSIQQLGYSMAMLEPQESAESKYLGHRILFTFENQRSHRRKALITKII